MKYAPYLAAFFLAVNAHAADEGPRNLIRIATACELRLESATGLKVSASIFKGQKMNESSTKLTRDFELDSASKSSAFFGSAFNRESLDYVFALVPHGTLRKGGGTDERIGDAYVLTINPVFDPNDLFRSIGGDSAEFAEDAIAAGRLRGQTRGWVKINAYDDGRIEASTFQGHLEASRVEAENGELEFTMPMELVDPSRVSRGQRLLGRVLTATRLGEEINMSKVELRVRLKITPSEIAPLRITKASAEPLVDSLDVATAAENAEPVSR